jgi:hypothetical protein
LSLAGSLPCRSFFNHDAIARAASLWLQNIPSSVAIINAHYPGRKARSVGLPPLSWLAVLVPLLL